MTETERIELEELGFVEVDKGFRKSMWPSISIGVYPEGGRVVLVEYVKPEGELLFRQRFESLEQFLNITSFDTGDGYGAPPY
ncbi:unnamed protein product [marine sediment metagenome]|uniref:Uncharacterized protein n=1 Tax=marine sediment metagenome TaxID=412755 RepID=X0S205_9ZZZZ